MMTVGAVEPATLPLPKVPASGIISTACFTSICCFCAALLLLLFLATGTVTLHNTA